MRDNGTRQGWGQRGRDVTLAGRRAAATALASSIPLLWTTSAWTQQEPASQSSQQSDASSGKEASRNDAGLGARCNAAADCGEGLRCIDRVCIHPRLGTDGESCVRTADCNPPLGCFDQRCKARGTARPGPRRAEPDAPYTPDPQNMSKEESDLYAEMLLVRGSGMQGMSGTFGFGYGEGGFGYSAFLSQRVSSLVGWAGYLGAVSGFDGGAVGAIGPHFGHVLFIDPMLAYVRPGNYSSTECYNGYMGTMTCSSVDVSPDPSLGLALAAGLELPLSRSWGLTPMVTIASTFEGDFLGDRNRVLLFTIGPSAMMGREEDYRDELKEMRKKRSQ